VPVLVFVVEKFWADVRNTSVGVGAAFVFVSVKFADVPPVILAVTVL
jgi:hypothetical protein